MNPAEETKASVGKHQEDHNAGIWIGLRRIDLVVKYLQVIALGVVFVANRMDVAWGDEKHLWWFIFGIISLNVFAQSVHIFLHYEGTKSYWPKVFPNEWTPKKHGSGFGQHYKFFYVLKLLMVAYTGFMVFQGKLDGFFVYLSLFMVCLLIVFDLLYYLFGL